jgi:hypothetical protein
MASKKDALRKINQRPEIKGGGSVLETAAQIVAPAIGTIPMPIGLVVGSINPARSTQAPMAYVVLDWNQPLNITPEYYEVEYGKQSDWTGSAFGNPTRVRAYSTDATLILDAPADYYARVRAVYRNTVSQYTAVVAINVPLDTTPPPDFDTYNVVFENGNLIITFGYTGVTPETYMEANIDIYDATHTTLYAAGIRDATGRYIWTEAANIAASSGIGVTDVSVDITPVSWTDTFGTTVNDTATSIAPDVITGLAYDFATGDLKLSWTNPTNAPYRLVRVNIYSDDTATTLYRSTDTLGEVFTWTVDNNFADTANNPDPSVYVTVQVVGWLNQASAVVNTTATKAPPAAPATVWTTWNADAGIADENLTIGWDGVDYTKNYEVTINANVITATQNSYFYSYAENVADHGGVGDASITVSVKARDRLNQLSAATVNNATNAPPDAADFEIDYQPGFSSVGGIVVLLQTIHDFKGIHWYLRDDTSTIIQELYTTDTLAVFMSLESGDYTLEAQVKDMFDQISDANVTTTFTIDALTVEQLRKGLVYTDRPGNSEATLAVLKDDGATFGAVMYTNTYHPSYNWTQAEWPLLERIRTITLFLEEVTQDPYFYIATSADAVTWTYFAGPVTDSRVLTKKASQAAAELAPVAFFDIGNRVDLSEITEARFIRVYHRTPSGAGVYNMYEFFPRRLVQSDDIEAESIKGINVMADTITGNHIVGTTLSAIKTSTGTLDVSIGGHIKSGMTAWNTGTGYYFDNNGGTPRFMIGSPTAKMYWDGTNLVLQGSDLILRTGTAVPYTQLDADGIKIIGTIGQYLFSVDAATDRLIFGNWVAQIGSVTSIGSALSFASGAGGALGTTQRIQVYNSSSGSPTAANILSYWQVNRAPTGTGIIAGFESGVRAEFAGENGDIGGTSGQVNTALIARSSTAGAFAYLYAVGTDGTFIVKASSAGIISFYRGTTARRAITDTNDGYLRFNNNSDYANGVFTPGNLRADGSIHSGAGGTIYTTGTIESVGSRVRAFDSSSNTQVALQVISDIGHLYAIHEGVAYKRLDVGTIGTAATHVGNATGGVNLSITGIGSTPTSTQRLRVASTGDDNTHYPLHVMNSASSTSLMYVRSSTSTSASGYLAATAWTYISDEKVKENIVDLPSQSNRLKLLKPKKFRYKGEDKDSLGFTAQDMQAVFPELVEEITAGDETLLGIKTTDLIPILIKEVIELREEVDKLKNKP